MADRGIMEIGLKADVLLENGFTSGQQCIYCTLQFPAPLEMDLKSLSLLYIRQDV